MRRHRRWAIALSCCLLVVSGSCIAANHAAVLVRADGTPVAINCGTWISRVTVKDAASERVLWSASATESDTGGIDDVGEVVLGELPSDRWKESAPLLPGSSPQEWLFEIESLSETTTVTVPAFGSPEEVYRSAGTESLDRFWDQTCTGLPFSSTTRQVVSIVVVAAAVTAIAVGLLRRRRIRSANEPL